MSARAEHPSGRPLDDDVEEDSDLVAQPKTGMKIPPPRSGDAQLPPQRNRVHTTTTNDFVYWILVALCVAAIGLVMWLSMRPRPFVVSRELHGEWRAANVTPSSNGVHNNRRRGGGSGASRRGALSLGAGAHAGPDDSTVHIDLARFMPSVFSTAVEAQTFIANPTTDDGGGVADVAAVVGVDEPVSTGATSPSRRVDRDAVGDAATISIGPRWRLSLRIPFELTFASHAAVWQWRGPCDGTAPLERRGSATAATSRHLMLSPSAGLCEMSWHRGALVVTEYPATPRMTSSQAQEDWRAERFVALPQSLVLTRNHSDEGGSSIMWLWARGQEYRVLLAIITFVIVTVAKLTANAWRPTPRARAVQNKEEQLRRAAERQRLLALLKQKRQTASDLAKTVTPETPTTKT